MPSDAPLVSIVIPVRNGEGLIERTLESALAQTYDPTEIIVVDDGSTDRTADIVEALLARRQRSRLFRRPHSGVSATRNFGAEQSRGEFIAPLDADDLWHPEKISRQMAAMRTSPKIGVVYCWAVEIDQDDFLIPPVRNGNTSAGNVLTEMIAKAGIIPSGGNPLIRRSYFDAVGGYQVGLGHGEDWKLYLALASICEYAVVPAHLIGYRRSIGSASRNVRAMAEGLESVSRWVTEKWPDTSQAVIRQMTFNRNEYLSHLALTNSQAALALRFKMLGYQALPSQLFTASTLIFGLRVLLRTSGLANFLRKARRPPCRFKDLAVPPMHIKVPEIRRSLRG